MKRAILVLIVCLGFITATPLYAISMTWIGYFDHNESGLNTSSQNISLPAGQVLLTQIGLNVSFNVSLYNNNKFVKTGAGGGYDFLFNGSNVTIGDITGTGLTVAQATPPSLLQADGSGKWMFGVVFTGQNNGGVDARPGPIEFTVANATIDDLLIRNNNNYLFAADIISGQTGLTGMIEVTGGNYVPEPSTLLLFGLGLFGICATRKNR